MVAIRSSAVALLSLVVVFIAACRRRRPTARRLLWLRTPAPVQRDPGGEKPKLADPQIDARFENGRIERHGSQPTPQGGQRHPRWGGRADARAGLGRAPQT